MTSPLRANTDGDSYTRMTVSLDGWGVEIGSSSLFLECSLMVDEQEGAVFARTRARYLGNSLKQLENNTFFLLSVASTGAVSIRATSQVSELQVQRFLLLFSFALLTSPEDARRPLISLVS